jgi:hypothetical protein
MHPYQTDPLWLSGLMLAGWLVWLPACVPIEPEQPEPNRPPHIDSDRVTPEGQVTRFGDADDPNIELSVDVLLDPNREETLYYAWYSSVDDASRFTFNQSDRLGPPEGPNDPFYRFEGVSKTIDACEVIGQANSQRTETIWLFVTDREFQSLTEDSFRLQEDAYVDSWAWVLEYAPGLSNQCGQ